MHDAKSTAFQIVTFLSGAGLGGENVRLKAGERFFAQGDAALFVFYLQSGSAKLTVISKRGKEATITLFKEGDFIGEEAVAGVVGLRIASATAVTACTAIKIQRAAMVRVLHDNNAFSEMFMKFVLRRGIRTQEDLVDQLFNSSEKRLARTLLLMAEFGKPGEPEMLIPPITQEALAEMIGTTRSRVSYFMNRFRKLGYIDYNGRIHVNKSLLNVVLHDQLPEQSLSRPIIADPPRDPSQRATRAKPGSKLKRRPGPV
jgi:CRP-like cAMP-binding protein